MPSADCLATTPEAPCIPTRITAKSLTACTGSKGITLGLKNAKFSVSLLTRTLIVSGELTTLYSANKFLIKPNLQDGMDTAVGLASMVWWEAGAFSTAASFMVWSASGKVEQIKSNIMDNETPTNGVYNPQSGTVDFSSY